MEELRKQAAEDIAKLRTLNFEEFLKKQGPMGTMSILMTLKGLASGEDAKYIDALIKKVELLNH